MAQFSNLFVFTIEILIIGMIRLTLLLTFCVLTQADSSYKTKPDEDTGNDGCCGFDCPKGQHCELVVNPCLIAPCPVSPQCTPDCPHGQIFSTCPSCSETRTCVTLHLGLLCKEGCYPPQCICPDQKHLNDKNKCVDEADCQPFPPRDTPAEEAPYS